MQTIIAWKLIILKCNKAISTEAPLSQSFDPDYDKVSAIEEVSLPLAAYFDRPKIGAKTDFLDAKHL